MISGNKVPHLLIAEDDPELRSILKEILSTVTPNILEAINGIEALQILEKRTVAAVVADVFMGDISGLDLLSHARHLGIQTPIVILSGSYPGEQEFQRTEIRPHAFVRKPFSNKELREIMSDAYNLGLKHL